MTVDVIALTLAAKDRLVLAGAGAWSLTGDYPPGSAAITVKNAPSAPDRNISLTAYDVDESPDPRDPTTVVMLQAHMRAAKGSALDVDALAATVDAALACHHVAWSGIAITRCYRVSIAPLGMDDNNRHEMTANYQIILP